MMNWWISPNRVIECVGGIFRSVGVRANPRQRTLKSLFRTFVDAMHVDVILIIGRRNRIGQEHRSYEW